MADFVKGLFGGAKPSPVAPVAGDADFADFAAAPKPEAAASPVLSQTSAYQTFGPGVPFSERPYTKWYRVNERVGINDFYTEFCILPVLLLLFAFHFWGTAKNRKKADGWIAGHAPTLASEFAVVGFGGGSRLPSADEVASHGLTQAVDNQLLLVPEQLLKEKAKDTYLSYATGRQNVAFVDVRINLLKRYNPLNLIGEQMISFFFESFPAPSEKVEITAYPFDGRENDVIPKSGNELEFKGKSTFEGFIWAIVHKDRMKTLRDERYDLSLTITKENAKLPDWTTVMSESAEISDLLLTKELAGLVKECGDTFESLIITDQPEDAPKTLDEIVPKKKLVLTLRLGDKTTEPATAALLAYFLRIPDSLVSGVKLRPEVTRKVKATREEEMRKIRKVEEQEKAEDRKAGADKAKKEEREKKLKGMTADEQRKFLDKERERDQRKMMGRRSVKA